MTSFPSYEGVFWEEMWPCVFKEKHRELLVNWQRVACARAKTAFLKIKKRMVDKKSGGRTLISDHLFSSHVAVCGGKKG